MFTSHAAAPVTLRPRPPRDFKIAPYNHPFDFQASRSGRRIMPKFMCLHTLPGNSMTRAQAEQIGKAAQNDPVVRGYR